MYCVTSTDILLKHCLFTQQLDHRINVIHYY